MSVLVTYASKYGSTKQYAEWIASELGGTCKSVTDVTSSDIAESDVVVCGGYLHIGKIIGAQFVIDNWAQLSSKRIAFFSVAGTPEERPERTEWFNNAFPEEIREKLRHFPLRGRAMDLDLKDRMLVAFPRSILYLKYWFQRTPENKAAIEQFKPFDGVRRENIAPLVSFLKSGH